MTNRWLFKETPAAEAVKKLSEEININETLSTILLQRGISTFDEAKKFFRPLLTDLHDPFLFPDMHKAVDRIIQAIEKKEKILVYGDYDVDGTTAVSLVYGFLRKYYSNLEYYIPDRYIEGYGISFKSIDYAAEKGISLIIALDCGIKANDKVDYARSKSIDYIICDHHEPGEHLPDAVAVLDAKRADSSYPYNELCGCGVGFKLMQAFCIRQNISTEHLFTFLDLAVISIAADIVPITDENRVLAYYGLQYLSGKERAGIKALKKVAGIGDSVSISQVVFGLAPRINAAGRIADAKDVVKLLLAETEQEAESYADLLNVRNSSRKDFDKSITAEPLSMIENDTNMLQAKSTVLYKETWHKGVIGIVASRCIEKYYRPTVILTESNGKATGSARSVAGFDLYAAIEACSDMLIQFGGHKYAAGLTLELDKIDSFRQKFDEIVSKTITDDLLTPCIEIDTDIELSAITDKFYRVMEQFGPFGPQNMQPVFVCRSVYDTGYARILKDEHLKLTITQDGATRIDAIAFGMADLYPKVKDKQFFDVCFTIEKNEYNGRENLQLVVKDIRF